MLLGLSDWSAELRILQDEKRRRERRIIDPLQDARRQHDRHRNVADRQLEGEGDPVAGFAEKRADETAWINGGYMVMEPGIFDYLSKDDDVLEVDLLERLTGDGQLAGYRHEGFWQCMDTLRDKQGLERLWLGGAPPWKRW